MTRIRFRKDKQREFLKKVIQETNSPSLKELSQRLSINYQTLKSYYAEKRLLPEGLFNDLLSISKIKKPGIVVLNENWGKSKGGKISRRK